MFPELFRIGSLVIFSYGVTVAIGFLVATYWAYRKAASSSIPAGCIIDIAILLMLFGILGARLFYVLQFYQEFSGDLWSIFNVRGGGLVFYGGFIFGMISLLLYTKRKKIDLLDLLDLLAPAMLLGYAIGRLGCFLNGCCYGKECLYFWGVVFPGHSIPRHPTQIYASLIILIAFIFLAIKYPKRQYKGQVFSWGVLLYSVYRFFIEYMRVNPVYLGLTSAQWISLVMFIGGIIFFIKFRRK